jgi:hypothetical protein
MSRSKRLVQKFTLCDDVSKHFDKLLTRTIFNEVKTESYIYEARYTSNLQRSTFS